ncbi:hypothetical protein Leryth_012246 [Lithospermum erythrorhizon]|nr:hypothetical protein Leryth_012246 [Lithospermum erythrorhizon]
MLPLLPNLAWTKPKLSCKKRWRRCHHTMKHKSKWRQRRRKKESGMLSSRNSRLRSKMQLVNRLETWVVLIHTPPLAPPGSPPEETRCRHCLDTALEHLQGRWLKALPRRTPLVPPLEPVQGRLLHIIPMLVVVLIRGMELVVNILDRFEYLGKMVDVEISFLIVSSWFLLNYDLCCFIQCITLS